MSTSLIPSILAELQSQFGIAYHDVIHLSDTNGNSHTFYLAEVYGAKVLFDDLGQPWMNEAEMVYVTEMSKQGVSSAINRLKESDLWELAQVRNLRTHDAKGREVTMAFYNEEVLDSIVKRQQKLSQNAKEFLHERKFIVQAIRTGVHHYSLMAIEDNARLAGKVEHLNSALNEETMLRLSAEWQAELAQRELNDHLLIELEQRYPEELD